MRVNGGMGEGRTTMMTPEGDEEDNKEEEDDKEDDDANDAAAAADDDYKEEKDKEEDERWSLFYLRVFKHRHDLLLPVPPFVPRSNERHMMSSSDY